MGRSRAAFMLLFLLASASLFGQEAPRQALAPRKVLLVVAEKGSLGLSREDLTLISRSLLLALQDARADLVMVEPPRLASPASDEELSRLAGESGADCWLLVEISGTRAEPILLIRSLDILTSTTAIDKTLRRQAGRELRAMELPNERWEDVAALLSGIYPPRAATAVQTKVPGSATLTVHALPGTVVNLTRGGKGRAAVGTDGIARIDVAVPVVCEIRATRAGTLPVRQTLYVRGDRELSIQQKPAPRLALDASALIAWPGMAVSWSPIPELLFVRAGFTTYLVGLVLRPDAIFSSDPLTNLDILAGMYLRPADSLVRFYAGAGGFLRFVHAPGLLFGLDPLAPAGIQAALGAEIPAGAAARFFVEYEPMLYVTGFPALLQATQDSNAGWVLFPKAALQLLSVRVGMRWPL